MFADGTNEVIGQGGVFVNISANAADVAFLFGVIAARFYIAVIISVGHSFIFGQHFAFADTAEKEGVRGEKDRFQNFQ